MSVIDRIKPDDSNKGFLRALLAAFAFMLISGVILVAGFLAWHYSEIAAGAKTKPITLTGKDFYIAIGKGDHEGGRLTLKELDEAKSAVISSKRAKFNASKYPIVEYKITGRTPGAAVVLYWRTITHNDKTLFAKLHWNGDHLSAYNMRNEEEWKGPVTELGISVSGDLRSQPINIEQITFSPLTVKSLLLTIWTEWNAFEGWTQKSINAIRGMPENALISPVVAAAAWCGLAMLLYTLWLFFYRTPKVRFELEVEEASRAISEPRHPGEGREPRTTEPRHSGDLSRHPGEGRDLLTTEPRHSSTRAHGRAKVEQCRIDTGMYRSRATQEQLSSNCRDQDPSTPKPTLRHSGVGRNPQPIANPLSITRQIWDFKAIVIMFMIAWFALDGKWQVNLWRQLADTKHLFAGKSHHEQHLAAEDAKLYAYAKKLMEEVLPEKPVRIFLLHEKSVGYIRLKLMYYLLPHNIYNFGKSPRYKDLQIGDYILAVNPIDLTYLPDKNILEYSKYATRVKLLYKDSLGSLYMTQKSSFFLGQERVNHEGKKNIFSGRLMNEALVISGVPTSYGSDPGVASISKDIDGLIRLRFQEWEYRDGVHPHEKISILAFDPGIYKMPDNSIWEVGAVKIKKASEWKYAKFDGEFPSPPRLFLSAQNSSNNTAVYIRANNVTKSGFEFIANIQESKQAQDMPISIAYLAVYSPDQQGNLIIEGEQAPYRLSQARLANRWRSFQGFGLRLQEEQSLDKEIKHADEVVDILVLGKFVFAQVVSNREEDTVSIRMQEHNK